MSLAARDLARAFDPVRFARDAGIEPDPWQADLLRSTDRRIILNCSRQSGKTQATAFKVLHTAVYSPNALILLLAPSKRQTKEFKEKVDQAIAKIAGLPSLTRSDDDEETTFENGSRVIALPGIDATIRGFSAVDLLIVDEASRVPESLYRAIRPMLAVSNGCLILLSTPFGKRGFFYEEWKNGGPDWKRIEIRGLDCPRIADFVAKERLGTPAFWWDQEYDCQFREIEDLTFGDELVQAALSDAVEPLFRSATWTEVTIGDTEILVPNGKVA